jgi:hypothetical protein
MSELTMTAAGTQPARLPRPGRPRRLLLAATAAVLLLAGLSLLWAAPAHATDHILEYTMTPSTTQAGGHPNIHTLIYVENAETGNFPQPSCECQDPRSLTVDAPAGVIANPHATPQCSEVDFANVNCPIDSQVGLLEIGFNKEAPPVEGTFPTPVFNLVTHPGQAGLLGFFAPIINSPIYIIVSSRTESDYGLDLHTADITHILSLGLSVLDLTLWGVPADPANNAGRLGPAGCDSQHTSVSHPGCEPGFSSNAPLEPFLSNPTTCGVPLSASLEVVSYDLGVDNATTPYPATTGCDQLDFNPSLFGQPTTEAADSPSGLAVELKVPQDTSPTVPSPSEIRDATVTLPAGFSINSGAADGKAACSQAAAHFGVRDAAAECPENAKVGTLTVTSSSLPGPLPGYIYLGEPQPGNRYRLFLIADGFGLHVKLAGSVVPDPQTGRLTVHFADLPQFPFSSFDMHFFGSERGLLATPTRCGSYPVQSTFTPWDSVLPEQSSAQFFSLDSGPEGKPCPGATRPFAPGFEAGVADKTAGVHAPFSFVLSRQDGDQNLAGVRLTTPPGFLASLSGVPYCPEAAIARLHDTSWSGLAEQATPACPAASQVGTAVAAAGAGNHPVHVLGKVYLAGPYKGAPLSLMVVIPAVSGPYDLGNVAVRAAVRVDPITTQVTATSDPLPQIIDGIPLRTRSVVVSLDRPGFAINPTNCDPFSVQGSFSGDEGAIANLSSYFQVANCASLRFAPKLSLRLTGGVKRLGHPVIHAMLRMGSGEANVRRVTVTLPKGEQLDNAHINAPCTRVQYDANACPRTSLLGNAKAFTPLLAQPLEGPVYLRSNGGARKLPDLVASLNGQIHVDLIGYVGSVHGRLRTTFATVPDAPISRFKLNLAGGKKGLLINSESLCPTSRKATVRMVGQNGKRANRKVALHPSCGGKARHAHRHDRHLRRRQGGVGR